MKSYDGQTKWMYFLTEDKNLLKKYNAIWNKLSADIKKKLIVNLPTVKSFENQKNFYGDEVTGL